MPSQAEEIAAERGYRDAAGGNYDCCPYADAGLAAAWNQGVLEFLESKRYF